MVWPSLAGRPRGLRKNLHLRGAAQPQQPTNKRVLGPHLSAKGGVRGVFLTSVSGGWRGEAGVAGEVVGPERPERWGKMWEAGALGTLGHPLPTPGTLSLGSSAKRGGRVVAGSSSSLSSRPPRATLRPLPLRLSHAQSPPARGRARGGQAGVVARGTSSGPEECS